MTTLSETSAWRTLEKHRASLDPVHLRQLFTDDPDRAKRFSIEAAGLFLDFSKQRITGETVEHLLALASQAGIQDAISALLSGQEVNDTEQRPALHTALRDDDEGPSPSDTRASVKRTLSRMQTLCQRVHGREWLGFSGKPITDVVNIGIGGSDLGPRMVCRALSGYADRGIRVHFVSNIDGADISDVLTGVSPESTLCIVTSKSFSTAETLTNAQTARAWLLRAAGSDAAVAKHFVAVTAKPAKAVEFGIDQDNTFTFDDWVGGRYSLWSAVGLPIALHVGFNRFQSLLSGARQMDRHFAAAPLSENMPVLLGLLGIWNNNFWGRQSQVIAPYAQRLALLPGYLQQLEMESNGKSTTHDGHSVDYATVPAIWGSVGTNGQHAYFQMLHQGPRAIPVDFVLPLRAGHDLPEQHRMLVANCFAQSAALMRGKTTDEVRKELQDKGLEGATLEAAIPPRSFAGNRPSNTILMQSLNPESLGSLIALYEHKVFVQSVIWRINAFDQFGVELGKQLAKSVEQALTGEQAAAGEQDTSTRALVRRARAAGVK